MIKIKIYAAMAATVLALAACTSDEETAPTGGQPLGAVTVSATIGSPLTRVNTEGDGSTFTAGDIIYVENLADGKVEGRDKGRYILQADGTTWQPCDEEGNVNNSLSMLWGTTNRFRGVYPATAADGFTLPTDQSTEEKLRSADYMTCEDTGQYAMPQGGAASLSFGHRMAKLTLRLTLNSQYTGCETISAVELYLADGTTAITPYLTETASDGAIVYTAILNPAAYTESSLLCTLTVGGTPLTARVPSGGITLEEGKAHTLNLRVGKNKIEMGTMTINEWGSTVGLEDKVAEEQPTVNATTHTITTQYAGQLAAAPEVIAKAVGTGSELKIEGPMNSDDFAALKKYLINDANTELALNLTAVTELTEIPDYAFSECTNLSSVQLSDNITRIGMNAFYGCTNLTTVNMPQNLISMGGSAFYESGLSGEIELPEGFTTFDPFNADNPGMQFDYTKITALTLPESLGDITVNTIRCYNCDELKTVTFKSTVKKLFSRAFMGSPNLTDVYMLGNATEAPIFPEYLFDDKTKVTIHVPQGALSYFSSLVSAGYIVVEITE